MCEYHNMSKNISWIFFCFKDKVFKQVSWEFISISVYFSLYEGACNHTHLFYPVFYVCSFKVYLLWNSLTKATVDEMTVVESSTIPLKLPLKKKFI